MSFESRILRAVELLKKHEPPSGYYLAFSGGKDSVAIKKLAQISGVRFQPVYNQTTIDPPELVRFIKEHHKDVLWDIPEHGNMLKRVVEKPALPPTRRVRWCCEEYKEHGGEGRIKIMGVRKSESPARKIRWKEVTVDHNKDTIVCPIVFWTDEHVWEFIKHYSLPYCSLYDEGWSRLGCVGCPLNNQSRKKEFIRWPAFERNWKKAVVDNWSKWKDVPTLKGEPRAQSKFKSGEEMWNWWMQENTKDVFREDCQGMMVWTNEDNTDSH